MKFEVYCDETLPDLLTSANPNGRYLMIGSLWLPVDIRKTAKARIAELRSKHDVYGEIKWRKVSPAKEAFYIELIDLFMSFGLDMRFRCVAVDRTEVNFGRLNGDAELGFYKFYYQAIHHWILDNNEYSIFCDLKLNRDRSRLSTLKTVLGHANRTSQIEAVQSLPSPEVVLLQLCDVLLGAASARMNERENLGAAKAALVQHLERRLDRDRLGPTSAAERKFNIFRMRLQGGW
ncbi:MAG: DUF3800 domain-containing protein [Pseudomonadota bacterium]